jgi:hypothetical protein
MNASGALTFPLLTRAHPGFQFYVGLDEIENCAMPEEADDPSARKIAIIGLCLCAVALIVAAWLIL